MASRGRKKRSKALRFSSPQLAVARPAQLAVQPYFLLSLGMETALVVALMLWVAWAWLGGRKPLAVILSAALILGQHDSALWLLILGLEIWRREKKLPWREAASVSALVLPWFLYAFWRYGSFLPNSAAAKFGQNQLMPFGGRWPTQVWQPGQLYSDLYEITLPDTLPAGEYAIRLGLYDAAGRAPLPADADDAWEWGRPVNIQ